MTKGISKAKEAFQAVLAQEPKEASEIKARALQAVVKRKSYTITDKAEIQGVLLERVANGESVNSICKDPDMPTRGMVYDWSYDESFSFGDRFARALENRAHCLLDDCIDIADNIDFSETDAAILSARINHAKMRIDARLRVIGKMSPNRYGDKVTHVGPNGGAIQIAALTIDSSTLDANQRDVLRQALLAARDGHNVIEHNRDKTSDES
jgi:hypothetical protein